MVYNSFCFRAQIPESTSQVVHKEASRDDPKKRQPDIRRAKDVLGWEPKVTVDEGLKKTIEYFREERSTSPLGKRTVLW